MTAAKRPTLSEIKSWPPTVKVEKSATAIGVSRSTAYESIRQGTYPLKVITVGRRKVVITASLIALLEGGVVELAS